MLTCSCVATVNEEAWTYLCEVPFELWQINQNFVHLILILFTCVNLQ